MASLKSLKHKLRTLSSVAFQSPRDNKSVSKASYYCCLWTKKVYRHTTRSKGSFRSMSVGMTSTLSPEEYYFFRNTLPNLSVIRILARKGRSICFHRSLSIKVQYTIDKFIFETERVLFVKGK